MVNKPDKNVARLRRHRRVRGKISGTAQCPRLDVFRSSKHIYAQLIDDVAGVTLASASSMDKDFEGFGGNIEAATKAVSYTHLEGKYALVRLPSGEMRNVPMNCVATVGQVGNIDHENVNIGKAGRKRHMGWRPTVRGSVMNPCDHPHGGGEGKSPVGRPGPVTPLSLIHI